MIDSVTIWLEHKQFQIEDYGKFDGRIIKNPNDKVQLNRIYSSMAKQEKKQGRYFPQIQFSQRQIKRAGSKSWWGRLEIQVSLPKLLFGTNFLELAPEDAETVYQRLVACLYQVGVVTTEDQIKQAIIRRIDFSKIIFIPTYYGTAKQVILRLQRFDYRQRSDFDVKDFNTSGEGVSVKHFNTAQSYTIYDKIAEVQAHGFTELDTKVVDQYQQRKQFVKFEVSLQKKQTVDRVLAQHCKDKIKDFSLAQFIANPDIAKSVLLKNFDAIFQPHFAIVITLLEMGIHQLEQFLIAQNLSLSKHAQLFYWSYKAKEIGLRQTLDELRERTTQTTASRYEKELKKTVEDLGRLQQGLPNLLTFLREEHEKFELIRPKHPVVIVKH